MRKPCLWALALGLLLIVPEFANAQERVLLGTLTKSRNSVTKVMLRAGCDFGWAHQVLVDSNIDSSKVRELPVGQRVYLRKGSCKESPPAQTAALSRTLLYGGDENAASDRSEEIAALKSQLSDLRIAFDSVTSENSGLKLRIIDAEHKLAEAVKIQALAPPASSFQFSALSLGLAALGALVIALAAVYFIFGRHREQGTGNLLEFEERRIVEEDGEIFEFVWASAERDAKNNGRIVHKYKCPRCSENNIHGWEKNLRAHAKKHPREQLVVTVDPALTQRIGAS